MRRGERIMTSKATKIGQPKGRLLHVSLSLLLLLAAVSLTVARTEQTLESSGKISIEWVAGPSAGQIAVSDGNLTDLKVARGKSAVLKPDRFTNAEAGPLRLELSVNGNAV